MWKLQDSCRSLSFHPVGHQDEVSSPGLAASVFYIRSSGPTACSQLTEVLLKHSLGPVRWCLGSKSDDPSSVPKTHMVDGRKGIPQVVP